VGYVILKNVSYYSNILRYYPPLEGDIGFVNGDLITLRRESCITTESLNGILPTEPLM